MTTPLSPRTATIAQRRLCRENTPGKEQLQFCSSAIISLPSPFLLTPKRKSATLTDSASLSSDDDDHMLASRWSPDSAYAESRPRDYVDSRSPSISSLSIRSNRRRSQQTTSAIDGYSSDLSINIVEAHRETVKHAQAQKIRLQYTSFPGYERDLQQQRKYIDLLPNNSDNDSDSDDLGYYSPRRAAYKSSGEEDKYLSAESQTIVDHYAGHKRRGMLPQDFPDEVFNPENKLQDTDNSLSPTASEGLDSENSSTLHYYVEFDDSGLQRHIRTEVEQVRVDSPCLSEEVHCRVSACDRGEANKYSTTSSMPSSSSWTKTSFFHHNTLRRHNSTDNFARAQLSKRLLENSPCQGHTTRRERVEGKKPSQAPQSSRIKPRENSLPVGANVLCNGQNQRTNVDRTDYYTSPDPLAGLFDLSKVNEQLKYKSKSTGRKTFATTANVDRMSMPSTRTKTVTFASQPSSPTVPSFLRKVKSFQNLAHSQYGKGGVPPLQYSNSTANDFMSVLVEKNSFRFTQSQVYSSRSIQQEYKPNGKHHHHHHLSLTDRLIIGLKKVL